MVRSARARPIYALVPPLPAPDLRVEIAAQLEQIARERELTRVPDEDRPTVVQAMATLVNG